VSSDVGLVFANHLFFEIAEKFLVFADYCFLRSSVGFLGLRVWSRLVLPFPTDGANCTCNSTIIVIRVLYCIRHASRTLSRVVFIALYEPDFS